MTAWFTAADVDDELDVDCCGWCMHPVGGHDDTGCSSCPCGHELSGLLANP